MLTKIHNFLFLLYYFSVHEFNLSGHMNYLFFKGISITDNIFQICMLLRFFNFFLIILSLKFHELLFKLSDSLFESFIFSDPQIKFFSGSTSLINTNSHLLNLNSHSLDFAILFSNYLIETFILFSHRTNF